MSKRERIIDIATTLFSSYGFCKTSLSDIATNAKLGIGTIYYHFVSKEELFLAVLDRLNRSLLSKIEKVYNSDLDYVSKITQVYLAILLNFDEDNLRLVSLIDNFPRGVIRDSNGFTTNLIDKSNEYVLKLIKEGQVRKEIRVDIDAEQMICLINHIARYDDKQKEYKNLVQHFKFVKENKELLVKLIFDSLRVDNKLKLVSE
ncbi:MAG: hypothetical protein B6226_00770 [Candidatus Cloacimonetes bacterium 4572_65]|nr:MAG: hypothetical protein B6226_00770 [Candidatus Cloacimonetes bacterium 4572_65]